VESSPRGRCSEDGGIVSNAPNKGKRPKLGNFARISAVKQAATRARAESVRPADQGDLASVGAADLSMRGIRTARARCHLGF